MKRCNSYEARPILRLGLGLTLAVAILAGCTAEDDTFKPPPPATIAFEGVADPAFVGDWVTASKGSTLNLNADGTATMINVAPGRGTSKTSGEWKLSDGNLLFKVDSHVTRYIATLTGNKLRLKQKSANLDVEYLRAKK